VCEVDIVTELRDTGIGISDTYHVLQKQVGGSSYLGYELRDTYNKLAQFEYKFDNGDTNSLIEIFNKRLSMRMISTLHLSLKRIIIWLVFFLA